MLPVPLYQGPHTSLYPAVASLENMSAVLEIKGHNTRWLPAPGTAVGICHLVSRRRVREAGNQAISGQSLYLSLSLSLALSLAIRR